MEAYAHSYYTVRFNDCDPYRHLNNGRYIDYFLNAREDHLRAHYAMDLAQFIRNNEGWVVASHAIQYTRPAAYNERVCILSGLIGAGTEHLMVEMLMLDEQQKQLKAILHTRFVPIDLETGRKRAHPPEFLAFLSDKIIPTTPGQQGIADRAAHWIESLKKQPVA